MAREVLRLLIDSGVVYEDGASWVIWKRFSRDRFGVCMATALGVAIVGATNEATKN